MALLGPRCKVSVWRENVILEGAVATLRKSGQLSGFKYPQWQVPLREAILEFDRERLSEKVQAAAKAIHNRLQELTTESHGFDEQQALLDGLATLEILKRERTKSCKDL